LKMNITGILVVLILIFGFKVTRKTTTPAKEVILTKPIEQKPKKSPASSGPRSLTQAQSFYRTIQAGLQQPRLFPFQPRWSGETYDPNLPMDDSLADRLKKHVELRNFYSSNARLTQEFRTLSELLTVYGIEPPPLLMKKLYMCLYGIATPNPVLAENPELAIPSVHEDFEKYHDDLRISMKQVARNLVKMDDTTFWTELYQIHPKVPFLTPDTRIEPGELLLIQ